MTEEVNLFEAPANISNDEPTGSYRERLVGEGKKFRDDEALARGKWESDAYIKVLENKLDLVNKELGTRMSLEEFVKTNNNASNNNTQNASNPTRDSGEGERSSVNEESNKPLTKQDILAIAQEAYAVEQNKAARSSNLKEAQKTLMESWGARTYVEKLDEVATRLGLGKDFLQDIAARSPQAFYELVGVKKDVQANTNVNIQAPPHSSVRPSQDPGYNPNVRNQAWWDKMAKENFKEWKSEANTILRHKDAMAMGAAFFTKRT